MKVALLCDAIYPYHDGGREMLQFERAVRLARLGHDVHVFTMHWWPEAERKIVRDGVTLHALSRRLNLYTGSRRSIWQSVVFGVGALRLLWSAPFDVLDVDQLPFTPFLAARLVTLLRRCPMTATWHEVWDRAGWRTYLGRLGPLGFWLQKMTARWPDLIFANSGLTGTRLTETLGVDPRRVMVLPPGGGEMTPRAEAAVKSVDCIFVGRLTPHQNVDVLLRALATLPGVTGLVAGSGPDRDRLMALARELRIDERVRFETPIDRESIRARLESARLLTLSSVRERSGVVILEANACGVPALVVRHRDNAALEMVHHGENGLVCDLDVGRMAEAIGGFLKDPVTQARMSKAARSIASAYSWETYVTRMVGSLQSMIRQDLEDAA